PGRRGQAPSRRAGLHLVRLRQGRSRLADRIAAGPARRDGRRHRRTPARQPEEMSKRPQNSPPPGRPGQAGPARRGPPAPYKRPVQSPDAETVMLAPVKTDPDVMPEPGPSPPDAQPPATEQPAAEPAPAKPPDAEDWGASTRVLTLPRGKRRSGPAQWSAPSARRTWVSRTALAVILCVQAVLSLRLQNTAFGNEALYL